MISVAEGATQFEATEHKATCIDTLRQILPDGFEYMVTDFDLLDRSNVVGENKFHAKIRVNVAEETKIPEFLTEFEAKSGTTYNKVRGDERGTGKKVIVRGHRKCQHNVRHQKLSDSEPRKKGPGRQPGSHRVPNKDTVCAARISFCLSGTHLHTSHAKKRSLTAIYKQDYPLEFDIHFTHNHSIRSADAMRYRKVSEEVKNTFTQYFDEDYSASSALANNYQQL